MAVLKPLVTDKSRNENAHESSCGLVKVKAETVRQHSGVILPAGETQGETSNRWLKDRQCSEIVMLLARNAKAETSNCSTDKSQSNKRSNVNLPAGRSPSRNSLNRSISDKAQKSSFAKAETSNRSTYKSRSNKRSSIVLPAGESSRSNIE